MGISKPLKVIDEKKGQIRLFDLGECEICGSQEEKIIEFDDCNHYTLDEIEVCKDCLKKALEMLE